MLRFNKALLGIIFVIPWSEGRGKPYAANVIASKQQNIDHMGQWGVANGNLRLTNLRTHRSDPYKLTCIFNYIQTVEAGGVNVKISPWKPRAGNQMDLC